MGGTMSEPVTEKHSSEQESEKLLLGSSAMQGWRVSMEDAAQAVLKMKSRPDVAYFAVFDGHGGDAVAKYAGDHLHSRLEALADFQQSSFPSALRSAFLDLDDEIRHHPSYRGETSGCAAVAALITKDEIYVANAGDSRAVLSSGASAVPMSFDHKPNLRGENNRIVKAGGFVEFGRVNGNLALSRALGDFEFKQADGIPPAEQVITAYPDIEVRKVDVSDEFLIIACDGIWDCVSSQTAVDYVHCCIHEEMSLMQTCESLMNYCMAPQSQFSGVGCDNMTIQIVGLLHDGETKAQWYSRIGSAYKGSLLKERFPKEQPLRPRNDQRDHAPQNGTSNGNTTIAGIKVGNQIFHVELPIGGSQGNDDESRTFNVLSIQNAEDDDKKEDDKIGQETRSTKETPNGSKRTTAEEQATEKSSNHTTASKGHGESSPDTIMSEADAASTGANDGSQPGSASISTRSASRIK